jgi:hypothetical protein
VNAVRLTLGIRHIHESFYDADSADHPYTAEGRRPENSPNTDSIKNRKKQTLAIVAAVPETTPTTRTVGSLATTVILNQPHRKTTASVSVPFLSSLLSCFECSTTGTAIAFDSVTEFRH